MPIGIPEEIIVKGNLNLFFGKKVAPNASIRSINFFMLLFFKERSPVSFTSIFSSTLRFSALPRSCFESISSRLTALSSEASDYINGFDFCVDGGWIGK